jgi:hypothetical protein
MRVFGVFLLTGLAIAQGPQYEPVATTGQIMQTIVQPASMAKQGAAREQGPQDDRAWRTVLNNSVVLQEAAQLVLIGGRAKDADGFVKAAKALQMSGATIQKAASEKDVAALQAAAGSLNGLCQNCHSTYRIRGQRKQ